MFQAYSKPATWVMKRQHQLKKSQRFPQLQSTGTNLRFGMSKIPQLCPVFQPPSPLHHQSHQLHVSKTPSSGKTSFRHLIIRSQRKISLLHRQKKSSRNCPSIIAVPRIDTLSFPNCLRKTQTTHCSEMTSCRQKSSRERKSLFRIFCLFYLLPKQVFTEVLLTSSRSCLQVNSKIQKRNPPSRGTQVFPPQFLARGLRASSQTTVSLSRSLRIRLCPRFHNIPPRFPDPHFLNPKQGSPN